MWIAKFTVTSVDSASRVAKIVLDCQTTSTPQLRLSREAKAKAPWAYSEAIVTPLASITLMGSVKPAAREGMTRAPRVC